MGRKIKISNIKRCFWIATALIALLALIPAVANVFAEADDVTDPAGDYMEWPESELFLMSPGSVDTAQITLLEPDSSLTSFTSLGSQVETSSEGWERAAAAGRILTPEHDAVGYITAQDSSLKFRFYQPGSDWLWQATDMYVPPKLSFCNSFMDLEAGDLDKYQDSQENYRDEVIIAYAGQSANNQLPVRLAVLDFSNSSEEALSAPVVTTANTPAGIDNTTIIDYGVFVCADNALAVTTGDFDGDEVYEIAVAYRLNDTQYRVDVYRYTTTVNETSGVKNHSLVLADSEVQTSYNHTFIAMDLAAGDFDSDGVDEVTVAYSSTLDAYDGYARNHGLVNFEVVKFFTADGLPTRISYLEIQNVDAFYPLQVQIAAGLFGERYSSECWEVTDCIHPDLSASQLVYAYGYVLGDFRVGLLYHWFEDVDKLLTNKVEFPSALDGEYFEVAAGGFEGDRSPDNYQWSVAFNALIDDSGGTHTATYFFNVIAPTTEEGEPTLARQGTYTSASVADCRSCIKMRMPAVAADVDGDSVFLGAPVVITLQNPVRVHFILQEPPKHAYWDQWGKQQDLDGEPGLVTLSRWQEFTSSLKLDAGKESTHSTRKTSSETMGWSTEVKAGASYTGPMKKRTIGAEFSNQFKDDWESEESTYNNNLLSYNWSFETETTWDDGVKYDIEQYDVWRYPVYGSQYVDEQNNPEYGYMDIMVPYSQSTIEYMGPAANVDGWEPTWENGNILSYPRYSYAADEENKFLYPDDLGVFYIPCQTGMTGCEPSVDDPSVYVKKVEQVMGSKALAVGGTQDTQDYTLSGSEGSGQEQSYTETMSENFELKGYYKKEPSKKHGGISIDTEIGGSFDMSNSWSDASTAETKTETSRTVTISKPALETTYSYNFYPELYVTQDGAMKLAYAAEPPVNNTAGAAFWENIYGDSYKYGPGKPDAALNLPNRFRPVINSLNGYLSGWTPETDDVRELIRGFFIREATPDPETGEYLLLSHEVTSGETVRLEVRVYNYTLSEQNGHITSLPVHFYAAWRDWSNPSNPVDYIQEIGSTEVTDLEPREWKIAAINWTPELKGAAGTVQDWRVFVELDPDNLIDEIYDSDDTPAFCILSDASKCGTPVTNPEYYIDPGQNNTGFRTVSVANSSLSGTFHQTFRDESLSSRRALMVFTERPRKNQYFNQVLAGLRDFLPGQKTNQVVAGQRAFVRIQVDTNQPSIFTSQVVLYDGDPNHGGKIIAIKKVHPGILGSTGNVAWVQWTPLGLGTHTLFARLLEPGMDTNLGNNIATLKVVVVRPPQGINR